jgi:transposase
MLGILTSSLDMTLRTEADHWSRVGQGGRSLRAGGDQSLVDSKYLWLYPEENLRDRHQERFATLRQADLKTGRAWAIKENLRLLWTYRSPAWGERHWKRWYFWATHSPTRAGDRGRAHAQAPALRPPQLLQASHHQRW